MGNHNTAPLVRLSNATLFSRRMPSYLRLIDGEDDGATPPAPKVEDLGFPAATPVSEMTPEQQAAYWRNESKKQQKKADAYAALGDPDKLRADLEKAQQAAEEARRAAQTDQERAIEDARKEGRAEGEKAGAGRWLKDAVQSHVALLSAHPGETADETKERVNSVLQYIDPTQFVGDDGALDAEKLTNFAASLGAGNAAPKKTGGDPLIGVLNRQVLPPQGAGGSVSALEQAAYERMNQSKTN